MSLTLPNQPGAPHSMFVASTSPRSEALPAASRTARATQSSSPGCQSNRPTRTRSSARARNGLTWRYMEIHLKQLGFS